MRQATISPQVAARIVAPLAQALRHLRKAHSVAHAVAPPDVLARMERVWRATTSTKAMLLAIWEAYPELARRDGPDDLQSWELDKSSWQWAKAWQWGRATRECILKALEEASSSIEVAAAAVAGTEPADARRFHRELANALWLVRIARRAIEARR